MDALDQFPLNITENVDSDGDGVGDNGDAFPLDPERSLSQWNVVEWGETKWGSSDADVIWNNSNWSE